RMFLACGGTIGQEWLPEMSGATLVVDALLGTGLSGPASGAALDWIRRINTSFPHARVVAVDIPSGIPSDSPNAGGESARADFTVTFTAPKVAHTLPPNCDAMGALIVGAIGSPPELYEDDPEIFLSLVEPGMFRHLLRPRSKAGHKGDYGHVLVIGGAEGKTGAAAMAGTAALRSGAGLVTVACSNPGHPALAPELMTESLPGADSLAALAMRKSVVAIGPGLGTSNAAALLACRAYATLEAPVVVDADALNLLASGPWPMNGGLRVLTPHPGEMSRLTGLATHTILEDRVSVARTFATQRSAVLVLKGQRTLIAHPDGRVWINPTGTPAMATGGSGDILTGMLAGLLAQFPTKPDAAVAAAVYVHGLAGELGAGEMGELPLTATDLLKYLPRAIDACL
ncbi:MAG: NAD(P)H-hydrate dehydratase, partial [Bryobacteraceae bacterium]